MNVIRYDVLRSATSEALRRCGVRHQAADFTADVLVTTDAWGVHTHGVRNLAGYLHRLQHGGIRGDAQPVVERDGSAWALLDGQAGLGHVAAGQAMEHAIAKAQRHGIGIVGVRNSGHFGAAGYYAWMAARAGLVGLCMANDVPSVAAPGSRGAVLGSNPLAYAMPAGRHQPVIFDISTAAVAGGKIYEAQAKGQSIPDTWLLDDEGRPTTDPSAFPEVGALQPAAGHKGYGFALMVEALSGALTGAAMTWQIGSWMWGDPTAATGHGAAFVAIDVATLSGDDSFSHRVESLVDELHAAEPADHDVPVMVPGEREWRHHDQALASGITLPDVVMARLADVTEMTGVTFPCDQPSTQETP